MTTAPIPSRPGYGPVLNCVGAVVVGYWAFRALAVDPEGQLFFRSSSFPNGVLCQSTASRLSVFCLFEDGHVWLAKYLAIAILILVVIGVAPALTCLPHWWVAWSLYSTGPIPDGGDQVAAVASLLLLPLLLLNRRKNQWVADRSYSERSWPVKAIAYSFLVILWLQVSVIYLNAMVAKLAIPDWENGTVLWYWIQDPSFMPSEPILGLLSALMKSLPGTLALGYGVLALELALGVGIVLPRPWRHSLLVLGLAFHTLIALTFGLWSFCFAMAGVLVVYFIRPGVRKQNLEYAKEIFPNESVIPSH